MPWAGILPGGPAGYKLFSAGDDLWGSLVDLWGFLVAIRRCHGVGINCVAETRRVGRRDELTVFHAVSELWPGHWSRVAHDIDSTCLLGENYCLPWEIRSWICEINLLIKFWQPLQPPPTLFQIKTNFAISETRTYEHKSLAKLRPRPRGQKVP